MSVVDAVERDLARLPEELRSGSLAASALELARQLDMDGRGNGATAKSMCARVLMDTMDRLRDLAPPVQEADAVDEFTSARLQRMRRPA